MDFSRRSYQKELLDQEDIPFADIRRNMEELDFINKHLGGHAITIHGLKKILAVYHNTHPANDTPLTICEIGCGGGDNLRVLDSFCRKQKIRAQFSGIDINPHCIEFARSRKENHDFDFMTSDYRLMQWDKKPDIIFCSLFCHHFTDEEVIQILSWMKERSRAGFFINDLARHPFAYYSIKWLTRIFSKSYLVKNDACVSVLRGFTRKEWDQLIQHSGIKESILQWKWAFRWLLVYTHE